MGWMCRWWVVEMGWRLAVGLGFLKVDRVTAAAVGVVLPPEGCARPTSSGPFGPIPAPCTARVSHRTACYFLGHVQPPTPPRAPWHVPCLGARTQRILIGACNVDAVPELGLKFRSLGRSSRPPVSSGRRPAGSCWTA